jgi:Ran GTPase-activating protein (RanGAP) involved in mRNA processing and transport
MDYSGNKHSKGHLSVSETEELVRDNLSADGKILNLTACYLKELGAKDIASLEFLKDLLTLELGTNQIGAKGVKCLASSPYLTHLTALNLYYNDIGNEGVKHIALSNNLLSLTSLNLSNNKITDEGAKVLAKFLPLFTNLVRLDLRYNYIKEEGKNALLEAQKMTGIKQILVDKEEGFQVKSF